MVGARSRAPTAGGRSNRLAGGGGGRREEQARGVKSGVNSIRRPARGRGIGGAGGRRTGPAPVEVTGSPRSSRVDWQPSRPLARAYLTVRSRYGSIFCI